MPKAGSFSEVITKLYCVGLMVTLVNDWWPFEQESIIYPIQVFRGFGIGVGPFTRPYPLLFCSVPKLASSVFPQV